MKKYNHWQSRGVSLIEFALVVNVFFVIIFFIYELTLMISIHDGLRAGMFYATRQGITGSTDSTVTATFAKKFNSLAFTSFNTNNLTFKTYTSLTQTSGSSITPSSNSTVGNTAQVVGYTATTPYTYLTSVFAPTGGSKTFTFTMIVMNENF